MKKTNFFAVMLCIVTLGLTASCSKDEKDGNTSIVGKWKCTSSVMAITNLTTGQTTTNTRDADIGMIIEFTSDGRLITDEASLNYTINGATLAFIFPNGEQNKFEIIELTSHKLKFSTEPVEEQGNRYINTLEFAKI